MKGLKTAVQEQKEIEFRLETGILPRGCLYFKVICGSLGIILLTLQFLNSTLLNMPQGLTLKCIILKTAKQKPFLRGQTFERALETMDLKIPNLQRITSQIWALTWNLSKRLSV